MRRLYQDNCEALKNALRTLDDVVMEHQPQLATHLQKEGTVRYGTVHLNHTMTQSLLYLPGFGDLCACVIICDDMCMFQCVTHVSVCM